jgi:hypothetical protein
VERRAIPPRPVCGERVGVATAFYVVIVQDQVCCVKNGLSASAAARRCDPG